MTARQRYDAEVRNCLSFLAMQPLVSVGVDGAKAGPSGVADRSLALVPMEQSAMVAVGPGVGMGTAAAAHPAPVGMDSKSLHTPA